MMSKLSANTEKLAFESNAHLSILNHQNLFSIYVSQKEEYLDCEKVFDCL